MNKALILLLIFLVTDCKMDDDDFIDVYKLPLTHAELGFELDEPDVVLNDLAKGELDRNVTSVLIQMFDEFPEPAERFWEFKYVEGSDKVLEMAFYLPHYAGCEKEIFKFNYNLDDQIESIVSTRENLCNEFEVLKTYTFNYNENGLLKSVFMDNDYFLEENYFGYYPNGKVKEIYNNHHGRGDEKKFGLQRFYYDPSFSNVIKVEQSHGSSHNYTYEYFYDEQENPFKDYFIAVSVYLPHIGHAYLSQNNAVKVIRKNENNTSGFSFTKEYLFNYSNNVLETYSDKDEDEFPYRLYSVNKGF